MRDLGGHIIREIRPEFFTVLPHIVGWIKKKRDMTDTELKAFIKINPALCEYLVKTPLEEIFNVCSDLMDHKIYGEHLEIVVSQDGRKWVKEHIDRMKRMI